MGLKIQHKQKNIALPERQSSRNKLGSQELDYSKFEELDGSHPWMSAVPQGYVPYPVRALQKGKVAYFNFPLAKEMGLIGNEHPHRMTPALEKKLIEAFALQIVNEYDQKNQNSLKLPNIRPNKYMATRYLQLQHQNKKGVTSGDGRGIWNGTLSNKGLTWDISSRGTGVTCLAPGAVEAQKPLRTGNREFGYGCGQAEIDELLSAAILAEAIHLQGFTTERVLCVIDLGRKVGIGVRAAPNLLRPAHLFLYLKQNRLEDLKQATDYLIQRQVKNGDWKINLASKNKYFQMCREVSISFAKFAAQLESDYVFAWMDWDGDNVLANGGIIDYGSVRQFGTRHDKYRYDDVERFSTNLNEQRAKARVTVNVFLQLADYLTTGKKKPLEQFMRHDIVLLFDKYFEFHLKNRILYKIGFDPGQRRQILKSPLALKQLNLFIEAFNFLEKVKVKGTPQKVADGINHQPMFNLRKTMAFLPTQYSKSQVEWKIMWISEQRLFNESLTDFNKPEDRILSNKLSENFKQLQKSYKALLEMTLSPSKFKNNLYLLADRSRKINSLTRLSGNALIELVDQIMKAYQGGLRSNEIQLLIEWLLLRYQGLPEARVSPHHTKYIHPHLINPELYEKINRIIHKFREDI